MPKEEIPLFIFFSLMSYKKNHEILLLKCREKSTKKHHLFEVFIYNAKEKETPRPPRVYYANFDLFLMDT